MTTMIAPPDGGREASIGLEPAGTLLDREMPAWDATRIERRVIKASAGPLYELALNVDFLDALRGHRVVRVLFGIRAAFERVVSALTRKSRPVAPPPAALRLVSLPTHGDWVLLGTDPPREIAFGVVGRFWAGDTKWETIDAAEFAGFHTPGYARIGCNLRIQPLGDGSCLLSYEARTRATDDSSRRAFLRYWRVVSPFVGVVMRSLLTVIERQAATKPAA